MLFLKKILNSKSQIYPFQPTPRNADFVDNEILVAVQDWLVAFKDYLPSADASEHAKGAHDAVDDLLTWFSPYSI